MEGNVERMGEIRERLGSRGLYENIILKLIAMQVGRKVCTVAFGCELRCATKRWNCLRGERLSASRGLLSGLSVSPVRPCSNSSLDLQRERQALQTGVSSEMLTIFKPYVCVCVRAAD